MNTIGDRIKKLLDESGYTQAELAGMVGVTVSAMSRYINNEREPKGEIIANLATALNTTSDYLISGKEEKEDFGSIYRLVARSSSEMTVEQKLELVRLLTKK